MASRRAFGVRNFSAYLQWIGAKPFHKPTVSVRFVSDSRQSDHWSGSYRSPLIRTESLQNRLDRRDR
jgi:hypothetical protein